MTPRTKTGAVLVDNPGGTRETRVWAIRAIEDEMLDKVAAAVERLDLDSLNPRSNRLEALAAIEDIRKEASDGR